MIRVLQDAGEMEIGGAETFVMNVYRVLAKQGVQFDFVMHRGDGAFVAEIASLGGMVRLVPHRRAGFIANLVGLFRVLREGNYAAIQVHTNSASVFPTLLVARVCGVKVRIAHSHSTSTSHPVVHKLCRPLLRLFATEYCACSKKAGEWLFGEKVVEAGQVQLIDNGVDLDLFAYSSEVRADVQRELSMAFSPVLGHVGNFRTPKNHGFLLEILLNLLRAEPAAGLVLVGDGPLRPMIQDRVKALNLTDRVVITGRRDDPGRLMQAFDVFVLPSLFEGSPVALVEAQASGLPCVVSDRIDSDVCASPLVQRLPLEGGPAVWARAISTQWQRRADRDAAPPATYMGRFDIQNVAIAMAAIYQGGGIHRQKGPPA